MGTSEFAIPTLRLLLETKWQLLGIVTRPDRRRGRGRKTVYPPVKRVGIEYGLPVYQPESVKDLIVLPEFKHLYPTVIIVVAFGQFLPEPLLSFPPLGCINLHPSLIPAYRGAAPIQRAIMNGETKTGITTMYLTSKMDAGDVILQEEVEIGDDITFGELADFLAEKGARLMIQTLVLVEQGIAPRVPQDEGEVTYAPPLQPEEKRIIWNEGARTLYNKIRGMNPVPGAHTLFKGKILKIWHAQVFNGDSPGFIPGVVVKINPKLGFVVQTGQGQLLIKEVQPEGRSRMTAAEFLRGYRVALGIPLGE